MREHRGIRFGNRAVQGICCGLAMFGALFGCDDSSSGEGEPSESNQAFDDAGFYESDAETPLDSSNLPRDSGQGSDTTTAPQDTSTPQDSSPPEDVGVDAILEDGFNRPDITPMEDTGAAEDAPSSAATIEGSQDCLGYTLETQSTVFTLKVDNFFITYTIRNECNRPVRMRVEHESDMFPVGIQKNGEPWIFLPDCPGTGRPFERTFNGGDGWRRGWIWNADDHDARLERCGVTFEEGAEYAIVGYGLTEVPATGSGVWSELFPMTEPIPITLVTSGE